MTDWSVAETLCFLECYQAEPCIWNPDHIDHSDKQKVSEAWERLSEHLNKPVRKLKQKKEILMVTFRKLLRQKLELIRSGAGASEIHEPSWFAYKYMEFLLPLYANKMNFSLEALQETKKPELVLINGIETEEAESQNDYEDLSTSASESRTSKKRRFETGNFQNSVEQQMATAFLQLTNALRHRNVRETKEYDDDDECNLYAKLLAMKLRKLPEDERIIMMYDIDGLFVNRIKEKLFSHVAPSP